MAIIRIVLRKEKRPDGTYPLAMRINKDGKVSFIYLDYTLKATDWDKKAQRAKKSYPSHARLNNFIIKKLADATDKTLDLETHKNDVTIKAVRNKVKSKSGVSFFKEADKYLNDLKKSGKYNEYTANKPRINHFKEHMKNEDISFNDVTVGCLDDFVIHLKEKSKTNKAGEVKKLGERSIANHLSAIRSVFAYAKRKEVIDGKTTPFGKGKIAIRFPDSNKVGLNMEEVEQIESVELTDERFNHCRNVWLFSFYFAGMRVSDLFRLKWSDFQNGRLYYSMGKNDKPGSLRVPEKAQAILDQYKQFKANKHDLVFPELKGVDLTNEFVTARTIAFKTSAIDKFLKTYVAPAAGIEKKLTMHKSRHTFGNISGNKIPIKSLQKLYRHTHLSTTAMYQQNFDHEEADNALDKVIGTPKP